MFDPTESNVDRDVEQSMEMFQRSRIGETPPLTPRRPSRLLLVLDGSSQDAMTVALSKHLKQCFVDPDGKTIDGLLHVLDGREFDGRENVADNGLAEQVAEQLGATPLPKGQGDSFNQILSAGKQVNADLTIVPCPFGRDLDAVGADSVGSVIDVLLARSPTPLMVVRHPYSLPERPLSRTVMALTGENAAAPLAAEWAVGMLAEGGNFELLLILEHEFYENVRDMIHAVDPQIDVSSDRLVQGMQQMYVRLHRALQKTGQNEGFSYQLHVRKEEEAPLEELTEGPTHPLLVLALERSDHTSQGHVADRIRHTHHLTLIVPRDPAS